MNNPVLWLILGQAALIALPVYVLDQPWIRDAGKLKGWRSWAAMLLLLALGPLLFLALLNVFFLAEEFQRLLLQSHSFRSAAGFAIALGVSWLCARASFAGLKRLGLIR